MVASDNAPVVLVWRNEPAIRFALTSELDGYPVQLIAVASREAAARVLSMCDVAVMIAGPEEAREYFRMSGCRAPALLLAGVTDPATPVGPADRVVARPFADGALGAAVLDLAT